MTTISSGTDILDILLCVVINWLRGSPPGGVRGASACVGSEPGDPRGQRQVLSQPDVTSPPRGADLRRQPVRAVAPPLRLGVGGGEAGEDLGLPGGQVLGHVLHEVVGGRAEPGHQVIGHGHSPVMASYALPISSKISSSMGRTDTISVGWIRISPYSASYGVSSEISPASSTITHSPAPYGMPDPARYRA